MTGTDGAVDHCHVLLHLVTGNGHLSLPVQPGVAGRVIPKRVRSLLQLHPLYHLHQGKVLVQLPDSVVTKQSLLSVKRTGDEPILGW